MQQEIRFRVVMDDTGVPAAAGRTETALVRVGAAGKAAGGQVSEFGRQTKLTGQQITALSQQTSDIAVSLAGGMNPFMVLLQQGTQLRDQFGGTKNVLDAYLSVLTPARVLTGGLAVAMGVLAVGAYQGYQQVDALTRALALNGQAAGVTRGELDAMAARLADMPGGAIGPARAALYQLASGGTFVAGNLELAGRAAQAMGRLTGQSAQEAAQAFDGMRNGVAQWAAKANQSYNFLTGEVYRHIRSLEAQGKTNEAIKVTLTALATTMESRTAPAVGYLQKTLEMASRAWSSFWDSMMGLGRPETVEQRLDAINKKIADAESSMALRARGGRRTSTQQAEIDAMRQEQRNLQEQIRLERRTAEARAATAAKNQKDIEDSSSSAASKQLDLQAAQAEKALAIQRIGDEAAMRALEEKHRFFLVSGTQFADQMEAIARRGADAEVQAAEAALKRAKAQPAASREDALGRQVATIQAETKVLEAQAKRAKVLADIEAGKFAAKPRELAEDPRETFRRAEITAGTREADQFITQIRERARQGARELAEGNKALSLDLIRDERSRGLAIIDNDERLLRERMQLAWLSVDERQAAEEALAQWRVLREQQLTEQLKPQWQRNAELWADTTRDMAMRYDQFLDGFVDRGRAAFDEFLRTGKVSTSSLTAFIRAEFARMAYERFLASTVRSVGNWIFNTVMGTPAAGPAGMPDDVPTRGGRANGGSVPPSSAWVVGERGPEVLVMGRSGGVVVPNHAISAAGAAAPGPVINQYFSVRADENVSTLYALAAMARQSAMAGVADARRRGDPAFAG